MVDQGIPGGWDDNRGSIPEHGELEPPQALTVPSVVVGSAADRPPARAPCGCLGVSECAGAGSLTRTRLGVWVRGRVSGCE
eukprot:530378-Prorocentrum_minimum.AAC.3